MVNFPKLAAVFAVAFVFGSTVAHPGEHHDHEQVKRELHQHGILARSGAQSLSKCAGTVKARALEQGAIARRAATAERLRNERGIPTDGGYLHRRDLAALEEFEKVDHNMTGSISSTDPSVLFAANTSCILTPEDVVGPYYVLGEMVRSNVTEGQPGVAMHLEMQFVDVNACEPVSGLLIDIWAANSTGVYSGINGEGGLNSTYMRGVQPSDSDGVAQFDTIFPGHYVGRATHQHVLVHVNASVLSNGSYAGGTVAHIGQLFFTESLRSAVEATYPYSSNTQAVTSNDDDTWAPTQADNDYDPFVEFVYLGNDISDGLLAWISIGIDTSANYTSSATAAAYLDASGGHETGNSAGGNMTGMGNGTFPGGNGTFPSGVPSGTGVLSGVPVSSTASSGLAVFTSGATRKVLGMSGYALRKFLGGAGRGAN